VSDIIPWICAAFAAAFWVFMAARIYTMWRRGISVLTIAPRRPVLNALGAMAFLGVLAVWSGQFVYLAFEPSRFVLFRSLWDSSVGTGLVLRWAGPALAVVAQCLMWAAIITMGRAWRMGIDDRSPGALVTHGVFRLSRNPVFLGVDIAAVSGFLVHPNAFFLGCAVCMVVGAHIHIVYHEERHLETIYGDAYVHYRERAPRSLLFL